MTKKADEKRRMERATSEVERLAKFLGISQSWGLLVQLGDVSGGNSGSGGAIRIEWPRHYKRATLTFNEEQMDGWSNAEMEEYVLHELVHLVFAPLDDSLKDDVGDDSFVYNRYHNIREGIVDQVAGYLLLARDGKRAVKL